jgi:CPA2 family monovalent cation:H+ antiporter-2
METEFLKALVLAVGVSALSIFLFQSIRMPSIVGFIVAGILIGPHGFGIIKNVGEIELLADLGIILLLFTIGIEFSVTNLLRMWKAALCGGGGQITLTILASAAIAYPFIGELNKAVFFGFLIALSSTAIVLKMLFERGEIDSPQGRMMTGILIFQDLCVVPLMLLIPALSGKGVEISAIGTTIIKAAIIIAAALLAAKWIVPELLHRIAHTKSRELFTITIIFMCLGIALLTSKLGLSLALGAFLAGLIISESEYAYAATAEILPLKDSFMGLFFVSIGMLMDVSYTGANLTKVLVVVLVIFGIKALTTAVSVLFASSSPRTAVHAGLGLAQIGEFSFVLAAVGRTAGLISGDSYQLFLSASVVSMATAPFVIGTAPVAAMWLTAKKPLRRLALVKKEEGFPRKQSDHVIIIGFGLTGRHLGWALSTAGIPYVVLDLNADLVRRERKKGHPVYFGDATSREILHKLRIDRSRLLVIAISDPVSTRKILSLVRDENPDVYIIVRTRYVAEVEDLMNLGANEVIPEEFETSIEIFSRVLSIYSVPKNVITDRIEDIRKNSYKVFRTPSELHHKILKERHALLSEIETETYLIKKGSHLAGHSLRQLQLRAKTGAMVMAVQRKNEIHQNPEPDFVLKENDIILLVGRKADISRAIEYMESDMLLTVKYHR